MAHEGLGFVEAEVACDVVAEGVAHQVRVDVRADAGAFGDPVDGALDGLAGHALGGVVRESGVAARVERDAAGDDVLVVVDLVEDVGDDRLEVVEDGRPGFAAAFGDVGAEPDESGALAEVAALEAADFAAAGAGADAEVRDAAFVAVAA